VGHLDEDALLGFVQHALTPEALAQAEAHLRGCSVCRRAVALLAETEAHTPDPTPSPPSQKRGSGLRPARKGKQIDRYVVLEVLGAGSMGIVYAAFDPQLDRKIALKMLAGESSDRAADAEKRARMMREAQAMARLSHPNVVHVHDVGTFQDQIFVAMEFIQGQSLTKWLESEKRSWRDVLRVFIRAGRGLQAAHAAGLVHRDFKPDNVMVGNDGMARVMDFGLVSSVAGSQNAWTTPAPIPAVRAGATGTEAYKPITRSGALLGTPAYMAPEQWMGKKIDHRADQFSFCVSLFEALYGIRPFEGKTLYELTANVAQGRIRDVPPGSPVPFYIRRAVVRGLAAEPKLRHESMQELLQVLELGLRAPRRRVLFGAGAAALLVVGGVLAGPALWRLRAKERCGRAAEVFAAQWDEARSRAREESFEATAGVTEGSVAWARTQRFIDQFRKRWIASRERACRDGTPAAPRREACLDGQLDALRALGVVLATRDAKVVKGGPMAAASLPSPEDCVEVQRMEVDAVAWKERELRMACATARVHLAFGDVESARRVADEAMQQVMGNDRAMKAEVLLAQGGVAAASGDAARARDLWSEAMVVAEAAGNTHARAEAAVSLAELLAVRGPADQAEFFANMAAAALERLGEDGTLRARLDLAAARRLLGQRKEDAAAAAAQRALETVRRLQGDEHPAVAAAMEVFGEAEAQRGRLKEALAQHAAAVAVLEKSLGPNDPSLAGALLAQSGVELALGDASAAREHCRRAVALGGKAACP